MKLHINDIFEFLYMFCVKSNYFVCVLIIFPCEMCMVENIIKWHSYQLFTQKYEIPENLNSPKNLSRPDLFLILLIWESHAVLSIVKF